MWPRCGDGHKDRLQGRDTNRQVANHKLLAVAKL